MEGEPLSEKTYNHIALKISDKDFAKYEKRKAGQSYSLLSR
jgi:predicted metalloenzyme YecM